MQFDTKPCIADWLLQNVRKILDTTLAVGYTEAAGGAQAEAVYAGEVADHRGAFLYGVKDQKDFFDSKR